MTVTAAGPIVVLGMMTKMPVAGAVWQTLHYLEGFRRLGHTPYYVEAHGRTPSMFFTQMGEDGWSRAARFVANTMDQFGFADRWAYVAIDDGNRHFGLSAEELKRLYRSAELIINLHGSTVPLPDHVDSGRLVYLETDPVELQFELHEGNSDARAFVDSHGSFFSWALNYGKPDCRVPLPPGLCFHPSPAPVVLDLWNGDEDPREGAPFTTVGNWRQPYRAVRLDGEAYHWSKHLEFLKFLDLPLRTTQPFELALSSYAEEDRSLLETNGWRIREALALSRDLGSYRRYLQSSRGEFTVAKDQNVRLRSGWFSERSAAYLAAGRPVITQDTGFGNYLPTGEGLFAFSTVDDILAAVDAVNADYPRHRRAALEIARAYFAHDVVLPKLVGQAGADLATWRATTGRGEEQRWVG
jgi:hypothetical protein